MGTLPQLASSTNRFKNTPLHAGKSTNQNPGPLDQNQSFFFFKNPVVTQCFPMDFFTLFMFSNLRMCYPNSRHVLNAKYTHLMSFSINSVTLTFRILIHVLCYIFNAQVSYNFHFQFLVRNNNTNSLSFPKQGN